MPARAVTLSDQVRDAYAATGAAWARGPDRVYEPMARALVAQCPIPIAGQLVLDLGAGTGAVSRAALAAGARVIAVDIALEMLQHRAHERPPALVADARALPLQDACVSAVLSGFAISHVPEPEVALAEARRVTRAGGAVLATTFSSAGGRHPAREIVDVVAARHGFQPPDWYRRFKAELEPLTGSPERLEALARRAGLTQICVAELSVDSGVASPAEIVDYRLGMAHLAPFVAALPAAVAQLLREEALAAVGPCPEPVRGDVLILSSRVPA